MLAYFGCINFFGTTIIKITTNATSTTTKNNDNDTNTTNTTTAATTQGTMLRSTSTIRKQCWEGGHFHITTMNYVIK